jgi:hypothetical protein
MTLRERLMTVMRGDKADRIPWTIYKWILQAAISGTKKTFGEIGLTQIDSSRIFKTIHSEITISTEEIGTGANKQMITVIHTPVGSITEKAGFDPNFGSRWITEHFIKSIEDYRVMKYVCDHTTIEPNWNDFATKDKQLGNDGIVLGEILPIPVMWLMVEIMGTATWCEGIILHSEEFEELVESLTRVYIKQVGIAADSPAEVIWFPDNVTGSLVSPAIFKKYCKPIYDYACAIMRQCGKLSFSHYDGDNMPISDCINSVELDIIEAFTPPPMGRMTITQARRAWPDKVLSINFPGNLFTEPAEVIEKYTAQYIEEGGNEGRFIIGCTEEFDFTRFEHTFDAIGRTLKNASFR